MSIKPKDIKPLAKALGIYEIVGGIIGILVTFWVLLSAGGSQPLLAILFILFALVLYAHSIYCGVLIFKDVKKGLIHSRINQLLQVISFLMFGYGFQYASGVYLYFGIDLTQALDFRFNFGVSQWQININSDSAATIINLNLVALYLIIAIEKLLKTIKQVEDNDRVAVIGSAEDSIV